VEVDEGELAPLHEGAEGGLGERVGSLAAVVVASGRLGIFFVDLLVFVGFLFFVVYNLGVVLAFFIADSWRVFFASLLLLIFLVT